MNNAGKKEVEKELGEVEEDLRFYRAVRPDDLVEVGGSVTNADVVQALEEKERELLSKLEDYATSM